MKVRIRWSDLPCYTPTKMIWNGFESCKFFMGYQFILLDGEISKERPIEFCVPYKSLINCIIRLPLNYQKMLKSTKCAVTIQKESHSRLNILRVERV